MWLCTTSTATDAVGTRPTPEASSTSNGGYAPPPLSAAELELVEALTRDPPVSAWPNSAAGDPGRRVPADRLDDALAPEVGVALDSLPVPTLQAFERSAARLRYAGPHWVERGLDGWLDTDPWLWADVRLDDLEAVRGPSASVIRLSPRAAPEEDAVGGRAATAYRSADRGLRALGGVGLRRGLLGLRFDGAVTGAGDTRLPGSGTQTSTRSASRAIVGLAGSVVLGGRPKDAGQLRLSARGEVRHDQPDPRSGDRVSAGRVLVGLDGRWRWGERGALRAGLSHQRVDLDGVRYAWQGHGGLETPRVGPMYLVADGLVNAGRADGLQFARREASGSLGIEAGPLNLEAGPLLLSQRLGDREETTVGWTGRGEIGFGRGWFFAAETRRGRDLLAALPSASTGVRGTTNRVDVVSAGPGLRGARGWFRVRAIGRWVDGEPDVDPAAAPSWTAQAEGALAVVPRLTLAGVVAVRPDLALHLSARYDAPFGFIEVHGRGRTEPFEHPAPEGASGVVFGFQSGLQLGAGFELAVAVENIADASVRDLDRSLLAAGAQQTGVDGRVRLAWTHP